MIIKKVKKVFTIVLCFICLFNLVSLNIMPVNAFKRDLINVQSEIILMEESITNIQEEIIATEKGYFDSFEDYLESLEYLSESDKKCLEELYEEYYNEDFETLEEFINDYLEYYDEEGFITSFKKYFEYFSNEFQECRDYYKDSGDYFMINVKTEIYESRATNGDILHFDNRDVFNKPISNCTSLDLGVIVSSVYGDYYTAPEGEWIILAIDIDGFSHHLGTIDIEANVYNEIHLDFEPMTLTAIDLVPPYYDPYENSFIFLPTVKNVNVDNDIIDEDIIIDIESNALNEDTIIKTDSVNSVSEVSYSLTQESQVKRNHYLEILNQYYISHSV